MTSKLLSIIIVTYKSNDIIFNCLESIYKFNDIGESLEVIIVDNSPNEDEMFDEIKTRYNEIVLIKNDQNGGYGQGNNIGIKHAQSDFLLIMNPDIVLIEPFFNSILHFLQYNNKISIIGLKQLDNNNRRMFSYYYRLEYSNILRDVVLNRLFNYFNIFLNKKMYISGALFFIRRKNILEIGGFDEKIFMYSEEPDIILRLENQNKLANKAVYINKYSYKHCQKENHINARIMEQIYKSADYYFKKHSINPYKYFSNEKIKYQIKILFFVLINNKIKYNNSKCIFNLLIKYFNSNK